MGVVRNARLERTKVRAKPYVKEKEWEKKEVALKISAKKKNDKTLVKHSSLGGLSGKLDNCLVYVEIGYRFSKRKRKRTSWSHFHTAFAKFGVLLANGPNGISPYRSIFF